MVAFAGDENIHPVSNLVLDANIGDRGTLFGIDDRIPRHEPGIELRRTVRQRRRRIRLACRAVRSPAALNTQRDRRIVDAGRRRFEATGIRQQFLAERGFTVRLEVDVLLVLVDDRLAVAVSQHFTAVDEHRATAQLFHQGGRVGHEQHRPPPLVEIRQRREALPLEQFVPDGQRLVDDEHFLRQHCLQRERQPDVHAAGVQPHRLIDEASDSRELLDRGEQLVDLLACESVDGPGEVDVLAAREVRIEPRPQLEQRVDPAIDLHLAGGGGEGAGDELQQRRLSGAVDTDDADHLPPRDLERDVAQRPELAEVLRPPNWSDCFSRSRGRS